MAQESWEEETDQETEVDLPGIPILCVNDCGFFGSSMTNDMCSKCYRDFITAVEEKVVITEGSSSAVPLEAARRDDAPAATITAEAVDNKQAEAPQSG